jgi:hypothetical protein
LFHPPQRTPNHAIALFINNSQIKQEKYIKYLGIFLDSNLRWKSHITHISKQNQMLHWCNLKNLQFRGFTYT